MRRISTKFLVISAILIFFVSGSIAYVLLGYQWPVGSDVAFYINANTSQVTDENSAVKNAADSWNQLDPSSLRLSYTGSSSVTDYGYNGLNTICWKDEGGSGTLATAWMWYSGNTILETDMVFNDYYNWSTSGSDYDVETVALHEFGHWVGLDHSSTGIMRPAYSGIQKSIDSDAQAGFTAMYGGGEQSPSVELDKSSLSFSGDQEKIFRIRNSGGGTLNYQVSDDKPWINVSPENGSSSGEWDEITTAVDTSGLSSGDHAGTISVTSSEADNSPQNLTVYLTISEKEDNPPSISITSPQNGEVVSKEVTIKAVASDDNGIRKVEFYVDDELKNEDNTLPYKWVWDTTSYSSGYHTIKAKAYDTINQTAEDSITIIVKADQPPEISITSPLSGSNVSGSVSVEASASDDNGIEKVEFYVDDELKKTDNTSPYEWFWDTTLYSSESHTIKAIAYDTIDQTAEDSISVTVDQPPTIIIASPASGVNVAGSVTLGASASDDIGIKKVEFYVDDKLKETDNDPPYEWLWDTTLYSSGSHTIKAKAYDTIDQTAEDSISVTVDQPPTITIASPLSGADVSGSVTVEASASDDIGIKKVEFYINGELGQTDMKSPYNYLWDTTVIFNGPYTIKAIVYDSINQTAWDKIDVILIPHAPSNFSGKKHNNSSTLLEQYINTLSWQANELNRDIGKYRIYQIEGEKRVLLVELDRTPFEYWHMNVAKDKKYSYVLTAVDYGNREGDSAYLEVQ